MSSLQKYLEDLKKGRNVEKAAEALGIEGDPVGPRKTESEEGCPYSFTAHGYC